MARRSGIGDLGPVESILANTERAGDQHRPLPPIKATRTKLMNREQAKKLLPIIQAFAGGETIQCRQSCGNNKWREASTKDAELIFYGSGVEYRVKPKQVVRWGIELKNGKFYTTAESKEFAEAMCVACVLDGARIFPMVEAEV